MTTLSVVKSALMAAVLLLPTALLAQDTSEDGAVELLTLATDLGSHDGQKQTRAAYATCLLFGHNGRVTAQTFEQDGWTIQDHADEEVFQLSPPDNDDLMVVVAMNESFCSVISSATGTDAALDTIAYLMTLSGEEVIPDVSDDGCPLVLLSVKGADAILAAEIFSDEEDARCDSPDNSHVAIMSIPNE